MSKIKRMLRAAVKEVPFGGVLLEAAFSDKNLQSKSTKRSSVPALTTIALAANNDGSLEMILLNLASAMITAGMFFYNAKGQ